MDNELKCLGSNLSDSSPILVKNAFKFFILADYRCTAELVGLLSGGAFVLCILMTTCLCLVCCCIRSRVKRGRRRTIETEGKSDCDRQLCEGIVIQDDFITEPAGRNGVSFAGPVYEQPLESSMRAERPAAENREPISKGVVTVETTHYSVSRPHMPSLPAGQSASVTPQPHLTSLPSANQPSHTNSFTANTFMLRKEVGPSPQASGASSLFPLYSTVNFGDTSPNYAQVKPNNRSEELMYERVQ